MVSACCCTDAFPTGIKAMGSAVVAATIDMYDTISLELLPTPTKSHYTFNLRDLSKVFLGISMVRVRACMCVFARPCA